MLERDHQRKAMPAGTSIAIAVPRRIFRRRSGFKRRRAAINRKAPIAATRDDRNRIRGTNTAPTLLSRPVTACSPTLRKNGAMSTSPTGIAMKGSLRRKKAPAPRAATTVNTLKTISAILWGRCCVRCQFRAQLTTSWVVRILGRRDGETLEAGDYVTFRGCATPQTPRVTPSDNSNPTDLQVAERFFLDARYLPSGASGCFTQRLGLEASTAGSATTCCS